MTRTRSEAWWGAVFIAPGLIMFIVFLLGPILFSLYASFFRWDLISPMRYTGLANYARFFSGDQETSRVFESTVVFLVEVVPISVFLPLFIAVLLTDVRKLRAPFQTIYFLPLISSNVAIALVWRWIFSKSYGLLNALLQFGLTENIYWLGDTRFALSAISTIVIWKTIPLNIILYLAAVRDVPRELYESARIDGCGEPRLFWYITFPMVSPVTFFVFVLTLVTSTFNGFDVVKVLTQGGPVDSTNIYVYYLYEQAFRNMRMGYGSAISFVFFLFLFGFTLVQFWLQKRWVHY